MKKSLKLFLLFLILGLSFILTACKKEYIKYTLLEDGSGYYVTGYVGDNEKIVIPSKYKKLPVTGISDYAFTDCDFFTSIEIPNSVKYIGRVAFSGCDNLKKIVIPESVTRISEKAFTSCSALTNVEIQTNSAIIEENAFSDCDSLIYNIYDNAKYLGNNENPYVLLVEPTDNNVASCDIHIDTKIIANYAFVDCKLTNIELPNGVEVIGEGAFPDYGCLIYNIYDNAKYLGNKDNPYVLLVKPLNKDITTCEINNNTKIIDIKAFEYCRSLTSIKIPNGVTTICDYAFFECTSLSNLEISESVTSIGENAFFYCNLSNIIVHENNKVYNSRNNCNALIETKTNTLILGSDNGIIPDGVKIIKDCAFYGCDGLTNIQIPDSVTHIGKFAFYNCITLSNVEIPNSVTNIGEYAFGWCGALTSIKIPKSVTIMGKGVFEYCDNLTIYCATDSKPKGWVYQWNIDDRPVVWGYKENK